MSRRQAAAGRVAAALVCSGLVSAGSARAAGLLPAGARRPWKRVNHAGSPVTLLEGPAWVSGAVVGHVLGRALDRGVGGALDRGVAVPVVVLAAGALGALDDLVGSTSSKGLRGHLGALARGEVTTGAIKVVGLAVTGLVGAALVDAARQTPGRRPARRPARLVATLLGGAVVAGTANAVNLFDLRPGRALKVTIAAGSLAALGTGSTPAAAAVGASFGVLPDDLAARSMLGDTGANAAGALLGLAVVERTGLIGRAVALAGLTALTLASERVSFSSVIAANPVLRRVDEWGRG